MSFWKEGDPATVETDRMGLPTCFHWLGQSHPVQEISNVWRVDDAWWKGRVWRDHFKLITTTGLLVILSHDLTSDLWYITRLYD